MSEDGREVELMKVWEKLLAHEDIGYNFQMVLEICTLESNCPARIENKYRFIGDKRMKKYCEDGCSVCCLAGYLDCEVKE